MPIPALIGLAAQALPAILSAKKKNPADPSAAGSSTPSWAPLAAMGLGAVGSAIGGIAGSRAQQQQLKQQQQQQQAQLGQSYAQMGQNDRQYGQNANMQRGQYLDQRATAAADLQKRANLTPLADKASYYLQQRAGASSAPWAGRDFTRGTMPGAQGAATGNDMGLGAQQAAMARYTAGAGGMANPALQAALARFQSPETLPGEYQAQSPQQAQIQAEIVQLQMQMARDPRPAEQAKYRARIAQLQAMLGGGAATTPQGGSGMGGSFGGGGAMGGSEMLAQRMTPYLAG